MKQTLAWHEQVRVNVQASVESEQRSVDAATRRLNHLKQELAFYTEQIATAEREGKDGFDSETYLKRRKK